MASTWIPSFGLDIPGTGSLRHCSVANRLPICICEHRVAFLRFLYSGELCTSRHWRWFLLSTVLYVNRQRSMLSNWPVLFIVVSVALPDFPVKSPTHLLYVLYPHTYANPIPQYCTILSPTYCTRLNPALEHLAYCPHRHCQNLRIRCQSRDMIDLLILEPWQRSAAV